MTIPCRNVSAALQSQSLSDNRWYAVSPFEEYRYSRTQIPLVASEIRKIEPLPESLGVFETREVRAELLAFAKCDRAELEFLMSSHVVVLLCNEMARQCHWSAGRESGSLPSTVANRIIFNPAQEHVRIRMSVSQGRCRVLTLMIQPAMLARLNADSDLPNIRLRQRIGLDDRGVYQALLAIQEEIEAPGLKSDVYIDCLLTLLLTRLVRCASNLSAPRGRVYVKGGLPNWRLKRALELIEGDQILSVADLARVLRMRPTSLSRAFKQSTGISPHRYSLTHRVNRAKEMIKNQERSLTEIALDCGFSGSSHFSVVFKQIVGMPPREYRRLL